MKRRAVLAAAALSVQTAASASTPASSASSSAQAPFLSISGTIGVVNNLAAKTFDFSEQSFLRLPTARITTSTPWTRRSTFVGPLLMTVMQAVGVTAGKLVFRTLDDFSASIPWQDLVRYGVILAHTQDGKRLSNKRWGPLWAIYPRDRFPTELAGAVAESRFVWQINGIEVSA